MNSKTKRGMFSRRALLKGLGGTIITLPLLELTHGKAWAADPITARRFITVFSHGGDIYNFNNEPGGTGSYLDWWSPPQLAAGNIAALGPVHQPLAAHMKKLLVVRGIDNKAGYDQGTYGGGHSFCNVSILTAAKITGNDEASCTSLGPSIRR